MIPAVTEQAILDALRRVPPDRWSEALRYLDALKDVPPPVLTGSDLLLSQVVGLWAGRDDLGDGRDFACRLRRQAETRSEAPDAAGH